MSRSVCITLLCSLLVVAACSDDPAGNNGNNGNNQTTPDGGTEPDGSNSDDVGVQPPDAGEDGGTDGGDPDMGPGFEDPLQGSWSNDFGLPGATGVIGARVTTMVVDGSDLYAGGIFAQMSGTNATGVARWNGSAWTALGDGLDFEIRALAIDAAGNVLAAGRNTSGFGISLGNAIKSWDGTAWSDVGSIDGDFASVNVIRRLSDGRIAVGGDFIGIEGIDSPNLAIWNGTTWSAWGSSPDGAVKAIGVDSSGRDCIGGLFGNVGTSAAINIACWDTDAQDWAPVGEGVPGEVFDILGDGPNGELLAAGSFAYLDEPSGQARAGLARWDGTSWQPFAGGLQDGDITIARSIVRNRDGHLVVGGRFRYADKLGNLVEVNDLARWDGTQWHAYGEGMWAGVGVFGPGVAGVYDLVTDTRGDLYVSGLFSLADERTALGIARYDGENFVPLAASGPKYQGLNGLANGMVFDALDRIVAAGDFTLAGGTPANAVARWDGTSWSTMGAGLNGYVFELAASDDGTEIWAGGAFGIPGPVELGRFLARYDGNGWRPVGDGSPNGLVTAIHFAKNGDVWVGGNFTEIGGVDALRIARFDGSEWHAAGSGLGEPENEYQQVTDIAEGSDGRIWATGIFEQTGNGTTARHLAVWDGTAWTEGAGGLDGRGADILADGDDLYVAGTFEKAGGVTVNSLARWDGTRWHEVGGGITIFGAPATLSSIARYGDGLFVTGAFYSDGESELNHLAWWDGSEWHTIGGGLNDLGEKLLVTDDTLWIGGTFQTADTIPSFGIARWTW